MSTLLDRIDTESPQLSLLLAEGFALLALVGMTAEANGNTEATVWDYCKAVDDLLNAFGGVDDDELPARPEPDGDNRPLRERLDRQSEKQLFGTILGLTVLVLSIKDDDIRAEARQAMLKFVRTIKGDSDAPEAEDLGKSEADRASEVAELEALFSASPAGRHRAADETESAA